MGRDDKQKTRDKNKATLPQTPANDIAGPNNEDLEFANEVGELYDFEQKPGFGPTGVEKKR